MEIDLGVAGARVSALGQLHEQLVTALDLSERLEEFLLAAQIALAVDTVRGALAGEDNALRDVREVGARAG